MVITPGLMFNGYSRWIKASMDAYLNVFKAFQEQNERAVGLGLSQADTLYQEGKNFITKWLKMSKGYQEEFRRIVEQSVSPQK